MATKITHLIDAVVLRRTAFPRGGLVGLDELPQQVLLAVAEEGGRTVAEISRRLSQRQPVISVAAAKLEELGYVEGDVDPQNRRRRRLGLTGAGQVIIDEYLVEVARREREYEEQRLGPSGETSGRSR
jgi:DNA-binding MarR family transcriptional regulator